MRDSKEDFCRHLCLLGFELGASREWVANKLRRHFGDERFAAYQKIVKGPRGGVNDDSLYDFAQNSVEANLMRSVDPDVTVDTSYYMYQQAKPLLLKGGRVLELACWTGGLASFIAANFPNCQVAGVDRVERIIGLNRQQHQLQNLAFHCWNYRLEKPAEVPPSDVLLCGMGINNLPDGGYDEPLTIRTSAGYHRHKTDALVYFRNWRAAANDRATLIAVLRVNTFGRFVAYLDAASEAGWTPELASCQTVQIPQAKQAIPALRFTAKPSEPLPLEHILTHVVRLRTPGDPYVQLHDALALAVYLGLKDRKILRVMTVPAPGGKEAKEEIGLAGSVGYIFAYNDAPKYTLALMSLAQVEYRAANLQPVQTFSCTLPSGANIAASKKLVPPQAGGAKTTTSQQTPKEPPPEGTCCMF